MNLICLSFSNESNEQERERIYTIHVKQNKLCYININMFI